MSLAYRIPLLDLAVGISASAGEVHAAGGRVVVVRPGGPCLVCLSEIDQREARYFLGSDEERAHEVSLGYVEGLDEPAPSVVSLNAAIAACATNEFAVLVSGSRTVNPYTELDLLGQERPVPSQWLTPRRVEAQHSCVQCSLTGLGDRTQIERYIAAVREQPSICQAHRPRSRDGSWGMIKPR